MRWHRCARRPQVSARTRAALRTTSTSRLRTSRTFALLYALLGSLYLYLVITKVRRGPDRKFDVPTRIESQKELVIA